ncbi:RNA polymerase sigma factor [Paenibacillus pini]|uniref:DNA-directed RNA polymerase n=1 Tax=Paenibacillus pini JCM 16418 TaxID=1236976 RepID=W7Y9I3_9BACL|nr:sigma-70 family RNA polymerase sigma factor [Paenibacillus pini]GAF07655.1 DNA-directed RNA polymerase [Paenibacillus pini JCM 16418]
MSNERFLAIYDTYFDDVYRFILFKTGNRWDTDDLVSEVFRKVFEKYKSVNLEQNTKSWLMTIARNTVIDYYRRRKDLTYGQDPEVLGYMQTNELLIDMEIRNECLKQSMFSLSADEKEIINLKYMGGLKYKEISEMLGKTEQWLKTKAHRIKHKMEKFILICLEG